MTNFTRRTALQTALLGGAAACARGPQEIAYSAATPLTEQSFAHGVASGDPAADSVVLWTRVDAAGSAPVTLNYEVSETNDFQSITTSGEVTAKPEADFTAKAIASGLAPGRTYFYRFRSGDISSPVGRTRTLPTGAIESVRFAVVSCSNFPFGYFNVYDLIARRDDIDAVLHLGDYIYEYGRDGYGGETGKQIGREVEPAGDLLTLADYRMRHAQYKADPSSRAMHAAHPMIAIWDDHEVANDTWKGGAEHHDPKTQGPFDARKRAALQAYFEWMPIREPGAGRPEEAIFRSFSYGDLLTIGALETRLMARSKQIEYDEIVPQLTSPETIAHFRDVELWSPERELMGPQQVEYISKTLKASAAAGQPWRLIANQVIMAAVTAPNLEPHVTEEDIIELEKQWKPARSFIKFSTLGLPLNLDAWDGYPAARERFYDAVKNNAPDGLVVITGDSHTWWANDLTAKDGAHMGVELGVHSVSSPSPYRKEFLGGKGAEYALLTAQENSSVRYLSGENHGYIALTFTREKADASYIGVDTVEAPDYKSFEKAGFTVKKSAGKAQFADVRGLSIEERVLF
ncbi:MAG: alkaline phosphatase D family protein [Parvularculaceae bacterium]